MTQLDPRWSKPLIGGLGLVFVLTMRVQPAAAEAVAGSAAGHVQVDGMNCPSCVGPLQKRVRALKWVQSAHIDLDKARLSFSVSHDRVPSPQALQQTIRSAGFTPRVVWLRASGKLAGVRGKRVLVVSGRVRIALKNGKPLRALVKRLGAARHRTVSIYGQADGSAKNLTLSVDTYKVMPK